jgi:hypothetical protein
MEFEDFPKSRRAVDTALGDPDPAPPGGSDLQSRPGDQGGENLEIQQKKTPRTIVNLWLMVINYSYNMVNHYSMKISPRTMISFRSFIRGCFFILIMKKTVIKRWIEYSNQHQH